MDRQALVGALLLNTLQLVHQSTLALLLYLLYYIMFRPPPPTLFMPAIFVLYSHNTSIILPLFHPQTCPECGRRPEHAGLCLVTGKLLCNWLQVRRALGG